MWFALAGGVVVVALTIWAVLNWRAFGVAEAKRTAARAASTDKYSRSLRSSEGTGQATSPKQRRQFGRR